MPDATYQAILTGVPVVIVLIILAIVFLHYLDKEHTAIIEQLQLNRMAFHYHAPTNCEKCSRIIASSQRYCIHCGSDRNSLFGIYHCPQCQTDNPQSASFCERCGKHFWKLTTSQE